MGFPGGPSGKELTCQCRRCKRHRFSPWVRKIPWRRAQQPTPVFLPGESHGQGSLVYSPWGHRELNMTERLSTAWHIILTEKNLSKQIQLLSLLSCLFKGIVVISTFILTNFNLWRNSFLLLFACFYELPYHLHAWAKIYQVATLEGDF